GIFLASTIIAPLLFLQQKWYLQYKISDMFKAVLPSLMVSAACALTCLFLKIIMPAYLPPPMMLIVQAIPITFVWYASLRWLKHPLSHEIEIFAAKLYGKIRRYV